MNDEGTLRTVAWSEVFPWLILMRCFRLAIRVRLLLLSTAGVVLTFSGWAVLAFVFSMADPTTPGSAAGPNQAKPCCPWTTTTDLVADRPGVPGRPVLSRSENCFQRSWEPWFGSWAQLSGPFRNLFALEATVTQVAVLVLWGLWALLVWTLFGSAICRIVAVELASGERIRWSDAKRHVGKKWRAYFAAPVLPLVGVLALASPIALGGLLLRTDVGVLIAGVFWPLALVGGLLTALLLLGLLFGWPLMWATISAEGTDSFDALSRCYAYVFQRPLHYLFYAIVASILGMLGWFVVSNFASGVIYLTHWAASWGAGTARVGEIVGADVDFGTLGAGAALIRFWCGGIKLLAIGFLYSYFWTASTAIYFLLRRDVDATELDEVFLDEDEPEVAYGLPALKTDEQGAPEVDDDSSAPEPPQESA